MEVGREGRMWVDGDGWLIALSLALPQRHSFGPKKGLNKTSAQQLAAQARRFLNDSFVMPNVF